MPAPKPKFNRYPVLWLAVSLAAGILTGKVFTIGLVPALAVTVVLACLAIAYRSSVSGTALACLAFVAAGITLYDSEQLRESAPDRIKTLYDSGTFVSGSPVEVEGVLNASPEASVDGSFLSLRTEAITYRGSVRKATGIVRVFVPGPTADLGGDLRSEISDLKYGSRVRVTCSLGREDEFLDPGVQTRREVLDRIGVDATCTVKSRLLVEHTADESVLTPLAWVYDQRSKLIDAFRDDLDQRAAGVMIASLLGNKYFLDKDTADLFREGGTFHILVISGLHITFIGGLLLLFIRQLTKNRWLQFAITGGVLWAYTLAVGADVPVVRASLMFTIFLLGYALYRQGTLLNSLGVCAVVLLAWRPSELFDPSFQLTFVSVAAIVACAYPLIERLRGIGSWTPTPSEPFPPIAPVRLVRFCEMLYWNDAAFRIEQKRSLWTGRIIKSPLFGGKVREWTQKLVRYLFEGLLVSAIVQLWMLPLTIVYFHRVSFAGVLLNLWVGLWIAVESFAAVAGAVSGSVNSLLATGFYSIADAADWVLLLVPRLFADNGWASFRLPAYHGMGAAVYAIYFVPLIVVAMLLTRWQPLTVNFGKAVNAVKSVSLFQRRAVVTAATALALLVAIIVGHPFSAPRADGRLHIDFLDVGQGDSALVTFPDGTTLLVDGGGRQTYYRDETGDAEPNEFRPDNRTIGEAVVSEVLWYKGYSRIDHILATHADADHIQGLNDVAKNFGVTSALFGRTPLSDPEFAELYTTLRKRGIPVHTVATGDTFNFDDATVEVLYPILTDDPNAPSDNNHSVVVRVVYGSRSFMLTGDIERQAELDLIATGRTLTADLVKVAHHGSRTSSTAEFIAASRPQYAVISVGRRSPFGHPHPDVVERWQSAGSRVMTTGENGMISVSTDGTDLDITRFSPQ
jgi:competence protein ComEC